MLKKTPNSIFTLAALLLALVGVSKPARAFLLVQANPEATTFTVPDNLPAEATVQISTSNSTSSINQSLKENFINKFPGAQVNIETQSSEDALQALSEGQLDLVGIGRNLTATERQQGFVSVPVSREKIAIIVSQDNPYEGNLTISQFAQIFRGEITDWSEIGGQPGAIKFIDSPETNDTRQAFPSYPVFSDREFTTGSNATQLSQDSIDEKIAQLGADGISYAVANDVVNRDDVKIVTMHQTQPDDERYPFSQPFYLVYQGEPSEATSAFLGFATSQGGEEVVASRVGSMSTAAATAIATKLANEGENLPTGAVDLPNTTLDGEGDLIEPEDTDVAGADAESAEGADVADADAEGADVAGVDAEGADDSADVADADAEGADVTGLDSSTNADVEGANAEGADRNADTLAQADSDSELNPDIEGSGEVNPDIDGSGEINPDIEGSGELNPDIEGGGEINPGIEGSGEINPDIEGSGDINPDIEDSGDPNAAIDTDENANEISPAITEEETNVDGEVAAAKEGKWWWWLPLILGIPILAAVAVSGFGDKRRSDNEPAITDVPNINPDGGGGLPPMPDGDNLSAVGANANVATGLENGVNSTSKFGGATLATGGAALAGGATAANFVAGEKDTATENQIDLDLEEVELPDAEIDDSVVEEIPSDPVTEFTGQETKLQITEQPTTLQPDIVDDIEDRPSGLVDGISSAGGAALAGGAAAIGGAAAAGAGLFGDHTQDSATDADNQTAETAFVSEQTTKLQTDDFDLDTTTNDEVKIDLGLDSGLAEPSTEIASSVETPQAAAEPSLWDLDTETADDVPTPESDRPLGLVDGISSAGGAALAGGAAAIGGAAAAGAGLFGDRPQDSATDADNQTAETAFVSEQTTKLQTDDFDLDTTTNDEAKIDLGLDSGLAEPSTEIGSSVETPQAAAEPSLWDLDTETADDVPTPESDRPSGLVDGISSTDDLDISLDEITFDDVEENSTISSLEEIGFDSTDTADDISLDDIIFDDVESDSTSGSLEEIDLGDTDTSTNISLDEITLDDVEDNSINASLEAITFDSTDTSNDINLDEITFDDETDRSIDSILSELNTDDEGDISLDDLQFEDSTEESTSDLLSSNAAEITELSEDKSNDMSNISTWLNSLETPSQSSEDIGGWLDKLNVKNNNLETEDSDASKEVEAENDSEDISFQFLEDLLERDSEDNK
ncbi:MAG: substrate-binding domain-containing protein [Cyanobacteria bacterium P01_G01_bin.19]